MRRRSSLFLLPLLVPCQTLLAQAGTWSVSKDALVSIGTVSDDSLYELNRAESAIMLSNGEIVVANRGSSQLRWYDSRGRYIRSVGRRGQGPGEFKSLYVFEGRGDTVFVDDGQNRRVSRISPDGRYIGLDSSATPSRELRFYDRSAVTRAPLNVDWSGIRDALLGIPHDEAGLRSVLVDRPGNLWVRKATDSLPYTVYDRSARRVGRVDIPVRFEVYQAFDTLVLGRFRDEDGVEAIQLRRLTKAKSTAAPAASRRPAYDEARENQAHREALGAARSSLRNLLTAQELHHAKNKRYASRLSDLGGLALPQGVSLTLIAPTPNAYWIVAEIPGTPVVCIVGVGSVVPFGFVDGCG